VLRVVKWVGRGTGCVEKSSHDAQRPGARSAGAPDTWPGHGANCRARRLVEVRLGDSSSDCTSFERVWTLP
jgi:hypothetical protein